MIKKERKIEENFLNSNVFTFESYSCNCKITTSSENFSNEPLLAIELKANINNKISFAYGSKVGLVRLNEDGSVAESNILGKLVAISPNDIGGYVSFFNANGFLVPLPSNKTTIIGITELQNLIDRLHATLELMSTITNKSKSSYEKIVRMIFYHLFMPTFTLETNNDKIKYSDKTKHEYKEFLEHNRESKRDPRLEDTFNNENFNFVDNIATFSLNANFVDSMLKGHPSDNKFETPVFQNVFTVYCASRKDKPLPMLFINDFLFHYFYEVGIIYRANLDKVWYANNECNQDNFSEKLKNVATKIAKNIIKEELERNLKTVRPTYNTDTLEPTWKMDSLLSALYFGLFYMKPNLETYRRCANLKCGEFFLVPISSRKKKYCCRACMNRTMAANKRARDKLKGSAQE